MKFDWNFLNKDLPSSVNAEELISNKLRISLNGISVRCLYDLDAFIPGVFQVLVRNLVI